MRLCCLPLLLLGFASLPSLAQEASEVTSSDDPDVVGSAASKVPLDEVIRYVKVFNTVRHAYVEPIDDKKLMQSAIRGLLLELDPHSAYFEKSETEDFNEQARGAYDGIGVELLQQPDRTLKVIAPIDDTPAARAGLRSGDLITAIDGKPIEAGEDRGSTPLRGPAGSKVTLTVVREGTSKPFDVMLVRETIRLISVRGRMLEPGYGYVRISTFQADTAADFTRALEKLKADNRGKLRGLVLDLRSNPGGFLNAAVQISDDLLDSGKIVSTRGRIAVSDTEFSATPGDLLDDAPMVVLIDAGSASASEVLAGALRDNNRARVVGSRSFGKGSVQTLLPLENGDSVKLTTARYYTPSGKSIQARGIIPDVVLHPEKSAVNGGRADISEASLPRHLRGDSEDAEKEGDNAGEVLSGDAPIAAALLELKKSIAAVRATPSRRD